MLDKNVIALKATCNPNEGTTTFNLGAIDAELLTGDGIHDLSPLQIMAMGIVQEGGLLKLDAVQGSRLKDIIGADTFGCGHAIPEDKWFGILPVLQVSVGPFDRKSQAMNAIVLALLGFSPKQAGSQPVEVHIGEPTEVQVPSIKLSAAERAYLRALTPEQFETKMNRLKDELMGPFGAIAKAIDPKLGDMFEKHAEDSIQAVRDAVFSADTIN